MNVARMRSRCTTRFIVLRPMALFMILYQIVFVSALIGWTNSTNYDHNVLTPGIVKTYRRLPSYFIKMLPHFDNSTASEVVANTGKDVFLPCSVRHLGDRTVSWIRRLSSGTLNVLTVGRHTYTMESRVQSAHIDNFESWNLQIRDVRPEDAGVYECQVSTTPKISRFVTLRVVESRATIIGGPLLYVNGGSVLRLTCLVDGALSSVLLATPAPTSSLSSSTTSSSPFTSSRSSGQTEFIFWSRNGKLLNYDQDQRQKVTVMLPPSAKTDQISGTKEVNQADSERRRLESRLEIFSVGPADSGNYTCQPSHSGPDVIQVFVIVNNDSPAAMQDSVMGIASGSGNVDGVGGSQFSISTAVAGPSSRQDCKASRRHIWLIALVVAAALLLVKR
ncbi:uncharacterized protein LOC111263478 isoform X2 [Varroa jacobsoni]|uniref:uncharacterized protein LOC111263478 isoform X2 n=1 Tax=Varroa jacobsoni TaxID=62625 RepID=UPI000BF4B84D|nr:uncharacterized protein LOC111263478 isoform X2 [Varroa jacobsoni]